VAELGLVKLLQSSFVDLGGTRYSDTRYSDTRYSDTHYSDTRYSDTVSRLAVAAPGS